MGLMIPWVDILANRVPSVRDFETTAQEILQLAGDNRQVIKGAAFWGSIVRGDLVPGRSDLDLVVVGVDSSMELARGLVRDFQAMAFERRVALDCHVLSANDAYYQTRHGFGPSYRETFTRPHPDFMVGVPLERCFRISPGSVQREMIEKMNRKLRSTRSRDAIFRLRHAQDPELIERWLVSSWTNVVRPMRVHVTLGRRLLWWLNGRLEEDGKHEVINRFLEEKAFEPFHGRYEHLVELDHQYDELLDAAGKNRVRRGRYLIKTARLLCENFRVSLDLLSRVTAFMQAGDQARAA